MLTNLLRHPLAIWVAVALIAGLAFAFGVIEWSTNLFVAGGIGLMFVGVAKLFQTPTAQGSAVGVLFVVLGAGLWLFHDALPTLTVGSALGVSP